MFREFLDQTVDHISLVLVKRGFRGLALCARVVVFLGESIGLKFFERHLRIVILVVGLHDVIDDSFNFGPCDRGLDQSRFHDVLEVKFDEGTFQLLAVHLQVVILVILFEFVVDFFDIVEFPCDTLKLIEVNFFVLASSLESFPIKGFFEVWQLARGEYFVQGSVRTARGDGPTAVPIHFIENLFEFCSHGGAEVILVRALGREVLTLAITVDLPVATCLSNI